ncbi:hypothetical protein [Paraconexibacter algicola]|uniref:Thioredoxin domain-containing protein n=1 Tax=Paraconexibacter algicola TaxID=2133960 RepID=A0A2T4UM60_9ACTN|nr:hypothetical protein [Paraconexibacter algicola]PTL60315.1 hypothetical protein C7Y72_12035 [Paraconexibacter algicola]
MRRHLLILGLCAATFAGCGGNSPSDGASVEPRGPSSAALRAKLAEATSVDLARFPKPGKMTLDELSQALDGTGPQVALGTSIFPSARTRLAFGLIDEQTGFVYAPSVVYLAKGKSARVLGPFAAPADLLVTDPPFRSRQAASEKDPFAAIYDARVDVDGPGTYNVLVASDINGKLIGSGTQIKVVDAKADAVPDVGERAPRVATDTVESSGGDLAAIDTRLPPDDQHEESLDAVLGKKPVAIVFATPQLCESRVCGPVVDIAEQLKATYGDRMTFIHQEVYVENAFDKGLRAPLKAFNLPSEPWLFTIDARGRVAERLEGSFGFRSFEAAIKRALDA